ncbi:hypothetical protein, partial [Escherichia coli]
PVFAGSAPGEDKRSAAVFPSPGKQTYFQTRKEFFLPAPEIMAQSPACNKLPPGSPFVASRLKEAPGIASMTSFTGVDL